MRGLRAVSDFEYEFQMALMNRRLVPGIETVFMMPAEAYTYISSRIIREVFALGGRSAGLVPAVVEAHLRREVRGEDGVHGASAGWGAAIAESPTMKLNEEATALRARDEPVIHLGIGEPKNPAPQAAIDSAIARLRTGPVKYTPASGIPSLKQAIIAYTEAELRPDRRSEERDRHHRGEAGHLQRAVRAGRRGR